MVDTKIIFTSWPSNLHEIKMAAKIINLGLIVTEMLIISKKKPTILKVNLVYLIYFTISQRNVVFLDSLICIEAKWLPKSLDLSVYMSKLLIIIKKKCFNHTLTSLIDKCHFLRVFFGFVCQICIKTTWPPFWPESLIYRYEFTEGLVILKFRHFKHNFGMLIPKLMVLWRMYKFWLSDLNKKTKWLPKSFIFFLCGKNNLK